MDRPPWSQLGTRRVRTLRAAVTAVVLAGPAVAAAADTLWERAVELAQAGEHLVPGTMVTRLEERGADGKVRSTSRTTARARVTDGETTYEVVQEEQDGQPPDRSRTDGATEASRNRFDGAFQADLAAVNAERDGERRTIGGQRAIGYAIEQPAEQYTLQGRMWLSEQGVPLELHYTVDPLPRFVQALAIRAEYDLQDDRALVSRVFTQVIVNVPIVYRRLLTIDMELRDYFDPAA